MLLSGQGLTGIFAYYESFHLRILEERLVREVVLERPRAFG